MSRLRLQIEHGPKAKKVVAVAVDWPGLSRGGKAADLAIATAEAYIPRYAPIAELAGWGEEFGQVSGSEVIEEYTGTGSTDFWGISFGSGAYDRLPLTVADLDRELSLLQAAWAYFDQTRARVSAELRRGPRGGGKDRDQIVRHTVYAELDMSKNVGVRPEWEGLLEDGRLEAYRNEYVAAFRQFHAEGKSAGKTPLRHLIRHTTFHTLDHTWEMEDKDLS